MEPDRVVYTYDSEVTDHAPGINAALAANLGREVVLPSGTYPVSEPIVLPGGANVRGESSPAFNRGVIFEASEGFVGDAVFDITGPATLRNVTVRANGRVAHAVRATNCGGTQSLLENIWAQDSMGDCYHFQLCQSGNWGRLYARGTIGGSGFRLIDCNNLTLTGTSAARFGDGITGPAADGYGYHIEGDQNSGGAKLLNANAENHWYGAALIENVRGLTVVDRLWTELPAGDGVVVRGNRFAVALRDLSMAHSNATFSSGTYAGENNRCVRFEDAQNVHVDGLTIQGDAGSTWTAPLIRNGSVRCTLERAVYQSHVGITDLVPEVEP